MQLGWHWAGTIPTWEVWSSAFCPVSKAGAAADIPVSVCRELLGQRYTETHYLADGTEVTVKPDVQVWGWSRCRKRSTHWQRCGGSIVLHVSLGLVG